MSNKDYWVLYRTAFKATEPTNEEIAVIKALYEAEGREKIHEKIKKKKVIPGVSALFKRLNIDADFWGPISDSYRQRNERVVEQLDIIYKALNDAGVTKVAVVENFGALLQGEADLCMFGSGDADNYADLSEKEKIYEVFRSKGFNISEEYAGKLLISTAFKDGPDMPDGFYFGINWDMTNRVNLPCFTTKDPIVNWDNVTYYKNTHIRLPKAEDLMYICLMHIAVHGFCKSPDIRLFYDVVNAAKKGVNWNEIVERAKKDANEVKVATGMVLSKRLLNVDIAEEFLYFANKKRTKRLLNVVSNQEDNALVDFPGRIRRLMIDLCSCDKGIFDGIKYVFFPDKNWVKSKYGSVLKGRIKHIISLL